ncbi:TetR/AcrR family transcriptional regulator [Paenibacillus lentus]|uniref:TetR/AcrR family transcriptional regulator n=1 Tax=Paenibacillus lentus TaxID=1338368 RepID=UPI0036D3B843
MNHTKQKIIDEALSLFSVHGFSNVSVKEIAQAVGIRDSSIYKHFASKREIFDTIIDIASSQTKLIYEQIKMPDINNFAPEYMSMPMDRLEQLCFEIFMFYLQNDIVSKFRKMLTIEQYGNTHASHLYHKIFIQEPLAHEADLFQKMIDAGVFKEGEPEEMALQFYGPLFLMLSRYDHQLPSEEEVKKLIRSHIRAFSWQYTKNGEIL